MRISDWSSDVCSSDLGDAEILPNATAPETGLEQVTRRSPRAAPYAEVAAAWELIRRRGQQPTPELIAREIVPDLLGRLLHTLQGSEGRLGVVSDVLQTKRPQEPRPPRSEERHRRQTGDSTGKPY